LRLLLMNNFVATALVADAMLAAAVHAVHINVLRGHHGRLRPHGVLARKKGCGAQRQVHYNVDTKP
jgi:hypothetical protein